MKLLRNLCKLIVFLTVVGVAFCGVLIGTGTIKKPWSKTVSTETKASPTAVLNSNENKTDNSKPNGSKDTGNTVNAEIDYTDPASVSEISDISLSGVVTDTLPSIVSVICTVETNSLWYGKYQSTAAGTGIIMSEDDENYYIATNEHVVSGAIKTIICLANEDPNNTENRVEYEVSIKGTDEVGDLAILTLSKASLSTSDASYVKVISIADSDEVQAGQPAIAIGNALGYGMSVTVGYISATNRAVQSSDGNTMYMIQTDAAINPGNSGGALINLNGELIGINESKYSDDSVEGMGFAIPTAKALPLLKELESIEDVPEEEQGYLGVYITEITAAYSESFNMPQGIYITQVMEGSAAEAAGLQVTDIIIGVNNMDVLTSNQLVARVTSYRAGTTIQLKIMRRNETTGEYEETVIPVTLMTKDKMSTEE